MYIQFSLKRDYGFDLQEDTFLLQGGIEESPGPDRAYLEWPFEPDCPQTLGLWLATAPQAKKLLRAVLALRCGPAFCGGAPWRLSWIRNGRVHVRSHPLTVDQGLYLLTELRAHEVLDRQHHLFGRLEEGPLDLIDAERARRSRAI
ncbi:MAG TPA: hypothetical protein PKD73_05965 [Burkholderiaceae bacterium]|nr:hypothetical protein [Burkholderiaceae bacterium]